MLFPPLRYTLPNTQVAILYRVTVSTRAELLRITGTLSETKTTDAETSIANDSLVVDAVARHLVGLESDGASVADFPEDPPTRAKWIADNFTPSMVTQCFVAMLQGLGDPATVKKS
jgi:hypothetical protein